MHKRTLLPNWTYLLLLPLFLSWVPAATLSGQVPTPPPNFGSIRAGAWGKLAPPPNPWDPAAGWDVVYNGQTFTEALVVDQKTNVLIINCTFTGISGAREALYLKGSRRVLVLNNTFTGHRYQGHGSAITVGDDYWPVAEIILENNTIKDEDGNGIATNGSSSQSRQRNPVPGLVIRDNLIHDVGKYPDPKGNSPKHGMYVKAADPLVTNNVVYNCLDGSGLSIRSTGVYRNNQVWNTKGECIEYWPQKDAGSSGRLIIENNLLYQDTSYPGVSDGHALLQLGKNEQPPKFHDFTVRFNTLVALPGTEDQTRASLLILRASAYNDIKAYGNVVVDLRPGVERMINIDGNNPPGYFAHNYRAAADRGFASLADRDFRLTAAHPAAGYIPTTATLPGYPATDLSGQPRRPPLDAGAYALSTGRPVGTIRLRARTLTATPDSLHLQIDGRTVHSFWIDQRSYTTHTVTLDYPITNDIRLVFPDRRSDLQVDYLQLGDTRYQTEAQAVNTATWQDGSCGGSYSDRLYCSGFVEFTTAQPSAARMATPSFPAASSTDTSQWNAFPNPAHDRLTVAGPAGAADYRVSLYDVHGRLMQQGQYQGGTPAQLSVGHLLPGLYTLRVHPIAAEGILTFQQRVVVR